MYIIELFCKLLSKKIKKEEPQYNPNLSKDDLPIEEYESCEHTFMPIDSSNEILACTKCGILKKREDLKNKNFFMRKEL